MKQVGEFFEVEGAGTEDDYTNSNEAEDLPLNIEKRADRYYVNYQGSLLIHHCVTTIMHSVVPDYEVDASE